MNKKSYFRCCVLLVFICAVMVLSVGCEGISSYGEFYEVEASPEKLREIEKLELRDMESEKKSAADVNEAAAKDVELTLEKCRALALANNLAIKVQLISPSIAAQRVSEEEARFEAAFNARAGYIKTDTPAATEVDIAGSQVDYSYTNLGVQVPLRTGGTVTFDLADNRIKTDSEYAIFNPSYGTDLSFSISQPLLRNAGERTNTYGIRIAKYERQISEARTKLEIIRVISVADRFYWRLYATRRELQVRKKEYDLAKAQLEQARRFVNSGERSQVEIVRAEAGVAEKLEGIIVAENSVRDRERELKRILNKPQLKMQTPTILITSTEPEPVHYELEGQRAVEAAIENRMEMLELELQIAEDVSTIDFRRNQALPLVTLDYTYNINGLGATRNDSYDLLFDKRFEDHRLGVSLLVPLGNEAAKSRLRQAFYQRRQRLVTQENRKALIELEVLNAIDQLEANWQRILATRQNSILSGRLFEAERRQFELGLRTSTDVLDAQTKFANAQSSEIRALAEYQIAEVDLAYATGTLLGAAKVRWEPIVPESEIN